jgi:hypothetical protein
MDHQPALFEAYYAEMMGRDIGNPKEGKTGRLHSDGSINPGTWGG